LNAQIPDSGDTPLHILAKVFGTLCARAAGGSGPAEAGGEQAQAEKFQKGTKFRIDLLVSSGAEVGARNNRGQRPLDLVGRQYRAALGSLGGEPDAGAAGGGAEKLAPLGGSPSKATAKANLEIPQDHATDA